MSLAFPKSSGPISATLVTDERLRVDSLSNGKTYDNHADSIRRAKTATVQGLHETLILVSQSVGLSRYQLQYLRLS